MAGIYKAVYRTIRSNFKRFFTISLVIAIALICFNGFIMAFYNLDATYKNAFKDHNMAGFTVQTEDPGIGSQSFFNYSLGKANIDDYIENESYGQYIEAYELRIVYDIDFNISGSRLYGRIVAYNTTDSEGNYRSQPDVNGYRLISGSGFNEMSQNNNVCLAESHLADYWKLEENDNIKINNVNFQVKGEIASPEFLMNMGSFEDLLPSPRRFGVVFMPLKTAQTLLGVSAGVNEISVKVRDGISQSLRESIAKDLVDYLEEGPASLKLANPVDLEYQVSYWLLRLDMEEARELGYVLPLILLIMALFGLYILLSRMVTSERKEIGVTQALGYDRGYIIKYYLLVSLAISLLGTIIGTVVGAYFTTEFSKIYVDMLGMPFSAEAGLDPIVMFVGIILGILTGLIGGYFPVRNSIMSVPAESLRYDPSLHITSGKIPLIERILKKIHLQPKVSGLRYPLRNFFRSKRRTASSLMGVIVGVSLISVGFGMVDSMATSIDNQYEDVEDWDLNITYNEAISNASETSSLLNTINGVKSTYSLTSGATITTDSSSASRTVQLIGLYENEGYLGHDFNFIKGEFTNDGIVITTPVAERLNIKVDDFINLEVANFTGFETLSFELINVSFRVSGIAEEFNGLTAFIDLNKMIEVSNFPVIDVGGPPSLANTMYIKLEDPTDEKMLEIKNYIYNEIDYNIRVVSTKGEQMGEFMELLDLMWWLMYALAIFSAFIAAALIYNTVYINLEERRREMATLLTMGTSERSLFVSVTLENILVLIIGGIFGFILGWILLLFIFFIMLDMEFMHIVIRLSNETIILSLLFTFIGMLIGQYFPLRKTLRMNLAEATKERVI